MLRATVGVAVQQHVLTPMHFCCCVRCLQIFFLLDVVGAVQQLFMMPEFAAARATARTYGQAGTWYASPHYQRLNEATGGLLDMLANSAWELGADGVQLTLSRKNSTSVFILRYVIRAKHSPHALLLLHSASHAVKQRALYQVPGMVLLSTQGVWGGDGGCWGARAQLAA
jgi:hypothetical protein